MVAKTRGRGTHVKGFRPMGSPGAAWRSCGPSGERGAIRGPYLHWETLETQYATRSRPARPGGAAAGPGRADTLLDAGQAHPGGRATSCPRRRVPRAPLRLPPSRARGSAAPSSTRGRRCRGSCCRRASAGRRRGPSRLRRRKGWRGPSRSSTRTRSSCPTARASRSGPPWPRSPCTAPPPSGPVGCERGAERRRVVAGPGAPWLAGLHAPASPHLAIFTHA